MYTLANRIRDDILYSIHRNNSDISRCILHLEYPDLESVYSAISNLLMCKLVSKLNPKETITVEELYLIEREKRDITITNYYVNLSKNKDTLLVLDNIFINNRFTFKITIFSIDENIPKEIKTYLEHGQYKEYKLELDNKKNTDTIIPVKKDKIHFISELLVSANTDYLKVYQFLAIEANNLRILGKYVGVDNINLLSSDTRLTTYSEKLAKSLDSLNDKTLPKIPIITIDKKIIVLGDYSNLEYIPSMIIIDPEDHVLHYTVLGDPDDIKRIVAVIKHTLADYPSTLDNRYKHLKT